MSLFAFTYPDAVRGLGDPVTGVGARSLAMGSTGITSSDEPSVMFINPAGLSTIDSKMFSFGFGVVPVTERVDTTAKTAPFFNSQNYFHLNNIAINYPLSKSGNAQFGLGFFPVCDFQYKHKKYNYSGGKTTGLEKITAEGAIYSITPALSFKTNFVAIGFAYNSLSGKPSLEIKDTTYSVGTVAEISTKTVSTANISGGQMNIGTVLFPSDNMRFGIIYKPGFEVENKYKIVYSAWTSSGTAKYKYPDEFGFGLAYFFGGQGENKIVADFLVKNWASFKVKDEGEQSYSKIPGFRNFNELHIGAEHKITQDVLLRYGFYYQPYYAAREFEKVFFTAGVGVNLSTVLSVDIAGEYGKRDYRFIDEQERFWDDDQRVDESIKKILLQGKLKW